MTMAADARDPWMGANLFDPAVRDDPYPALARLREIDPVNETPIGFWRLTRYADVDRLLHDVPAGVRTSRRACERWAASCRAWTRRRRARGTSCCSRIPRRTRGSGSW